jgi:hypothetical protein
MALVAKETLRKGHRVIANAGTVVSAAMVARHGWQDKVREDGITRSTDPACPPPVPRPPAADEAKPARKPRAPRKPKAEK